MFIIPVVTPKPSKIEAVYRPGPIVDSKFTPEEMARIKAGN